MQLHALKCVCLDFFTNMCSVLLPSVILLHPIARKQNSRRVSGEMLSVTFGVNSSVAVMAREGSIDGVMRFIVFSTGSGTYKGFCCCCLHSWFCHWCLGSYDGEFFFGIGRIGYNHDVIDFHPTSLKMFKLPMSLRWWRAGDHRVDRKENGQLFSGRETRLCVLKQLMLVHEG